LRCTFHFRVHNDSHDHSINCHYKRVHVERVCFCHISIFVFVCLLVYICVCRGRVRPRWNKAKYTHIGVCLCILVFVRLARTIGITCFTENDRNEILRPDPRRLHGSANKTRASQKNAPTRWQKCSKSGKI